MAEIKSKSVRGGAMTMATQAISITIQITSTVVLSRLLTPNDYGIMAMVFAVTGFAGLFRDLGLSSAAIQKQDLTPALQSNLFWVNVGMGALLTTLVAACSPIVAWFYDKSELTLVTLALSINFILGSLGTQHGALLVRNMQFGRQTVTNISGALVTLVVTVALALQNWSYWSLVWGNLSGGIITTILLAILSPFRPGLPSKGTGISTMLKFGANVTAFEIINYFQRNLDNILIGRFWGTGALGVYSRAYSLLMLPINSIRNPITAVAFPAMSKLQSAPIAYRSYYIGITALLALTGMPLTAFLFLYSKSLICIALGPNWESCSQIFSVLALAAFIQPTLSLIGIVSLSRGNASRYFWLGTLHALVVCIGFLIGLRWGSLGIAISYTISNYITAIPLLYWTFKDTPISILDYFSAVAPASLAAIGTATLIYIIPSLPSMHSLIITLLINAFIFSVIYCALLLVFPTIRNDARKHLTSIHSGHYTKSN